MQLHITLQYNILCKSKSKYGIYCRLLVLVVVAAFSFFFQFFLFLPGNPAGNTLPSQGGYGTSPLFKPRLLLKWTPNLSVSLHLPYKGGGTIGRSQNIDKKKAILWWSSQEVTRTLHLWKTNRRFLYLLKKKDLSLKKRQRMQSSHLKSVTRNILNFCSWGLVLFIDKAFYPLFIQTLWTSGLQLTEHPPCW